VVTVGVYSAIASLGVVGYYGIFELHVLGLAQPSFGGVDAILMSMPSLVYVLAISGAIHIVNYYHDAVEQDGREDAAATALAHGWGPCTLAALTTALGLLSLCISDLVPINKFGFWSAVGVLTTLVILFTMLPAWLHVWPPRERKTATADGQSGLLNTGGRRLADVIIRRNPLVAASCAVAMIVIAFGLTRTTTSVRLMKLFDPSSRVIADYTWLEENLGNLVPMEVVLRIDKPSDDLSYYDRMKLVSDVQRKIEALPHVSKTMSAVSEAPPLPRKEDFKNKGTLGAFLGSSKYRFKKACRIYSQRMAENRGELLERDYLSEDDHQELWRISCRVSALEDVDYGQFVETLKAVVDPLVQARVGEGQASIDVTYTGVVPLVYKSQHELLRGLVNSIAMAFVLIALVMMIVLRSFSAGLVSMLPNIFPIAVIFGSLGWLGVAIDIGTMMTASVAMGVAVDDTVHFLTWFRHGMKDLSLDRKQATRLAMRRCGRAMMQTTAVGGLGLLVFALSSFTPTQRFGYLMFLLLAAALVGDLVFLPALLSGPIGRLFGRARAKPPAEVAGRIDESQIDGAQTEVPPPHGKTKTGTHIRADAAHQWSRG
ncbi:MAG: MMPL family transporter, partial [Planctomycetes bacterium]|nr:MMPL family transporter [Planctomycetota bacterium]